MRALTASYKPYKQRACGQGGFPRALWPREEQRVTKRGSEEREFFSSPQRRGGYLLFVVALGWVGVTWHRFAQGRLCPHSSWDPKAGKTTQGNCRTVFVHAGFSQQSRKTDTFGPFELRPPPSSRRLELKGLRFGFSGAGLRSSRQLESTALRVSMEPGKPTSSPNFQTPWDLDQRPPILNS